MKKRDLRAELFAAELEAKNKKRKAEGKPPLSIESGTSESGQDEESNKRRKLLQEALEADKDSDDEEEGGEEGEKKSKAGDAEEDDRCVGGRWK